MKLVVQQVNYAKVMIDNQLYSEINQGLLIFIGIHKEDTLDKIQYLIKKILKLRIFTDQNNKMNLSVLDLNLSIMLISQFTLYADTKRGNRPSFINTADPNKAEKLYNLFIKKLNECGVNLKTGKFGANMQIELMNNGPKTFILES
tara:strand:+ start:15398 stop:15835 length:438 start_codon:yes stop_codon:yes gene_type:complete